MRRASAHEPPRARQRRFLPVLMAGGDAPRLPRVDVIILSWERVDDTLQAVDSALAQEGVAVTVIVVDQGSGPGALAALRAALAGREGVVFHELGRNLGVPQGRNVAGRLARAEIVVALDSDAVFAGREALSTLAERCAADPALAAIGFRILDAATGRDDLAAWGYPRTQLAMAGEPFLTTRFVGTGHAYRRAAFEAAGGYDGELFFCWEEVDLCLRLINRGYTILYEPAIVVLHKNSPERRMAWSGQRYYYFVRNRVLIELKYCARPWPGLVLAGGYLVKGAVNGLAWQAMRGCRDALRMAWRRRREPGWRDEVLSAAANRYIDAHERRYRGSLWRRLRREVLARLP